MPLSKTKLKQIAQSLPNGVLSNGISDSGVKEINRIVDKLHGLLFPKDSSVVLANVQSRLYTLAQDVPLLQVAGNDVSLNQRKCSGDDRIPLSTIKKMIRDHAGNVRVGDDVLEFLCPLLNSLIKLIMLESANEIKDGVAVLDGKHIKSGLSSNAELRPLAQALTKAKPKLRSSSGKKRRSSSRKRRSSSGKRRSSSRKRCGRGKSPIKGFTRDDGVRVKAHCRKM